MQYCLQRKHMQTLNETKEALYTAQGHFKIVVLSVPDTHTLVDVAFVFQPNALVERVKGHT